MPVSPEIISEVRQLLGLLRDELISEEQAARLADLLRSEAELRRLYIQYTAMQEHLRESLADYTFVSDPQQAECAAMLMDALDSVRQTDESEDERPDTLVFGQVVNDVEEESEQIAIGPRSVPAKPDNRHVVRSGANHWLAALVAASVVIIIGTSILLSPPSWKKQQAIAPPPAPISPPVLASITAEDQAVWSMAPTREGGLAGRGALNLLKGSAELTFGAGAEVILEAPVQLTLDSSSSLALQSGKLTATAHGGGFVVRTPTAVITDLGTEFGVAAQDSGAVVCVFQGSVAVAPKTAATEMPATLVPAGTGVVANNTGQIKPAAAATSLSFMRNDEFQARIGSLRGSDFDRWQAFTYSVRRDPDLLAYYSFSASDQGGNRLTNLAATGGAYDATLNSLGPVSALWTQGRIPGKGAISLQADGDAAYFNIPDSLKAMTVIAWVRLDDYPSYYAGILNSDGNVSGRCYFGIKHPADLNFHGYVGGKGALNPLNRTTTINRWTQVAAVFDVNSQTASLYGQGQYLGSEKLKNAQPIVPGKMNIGCWSRAANELYRFPGAIDELAVYRRALTAGEIHSLYNDGRP